MTQESMGNYEASWHAVGDEIILHVNNDEHDRPRLLDGGAGVEVRSYVLVTVGHRTSQSCLSDGDKSHRSGGLGFLKEQIWTWKPNRHLRPKHHSARQVNPRRCI